MTNAFDPFRRRSAMPLRSRLMALYFAMQPVQILAGVGSPLANSVAWAIGSCLDGEWAVLDAWPVSAPGPQFWRSVFDEFRDRGVERISFLSADEPAVVRSAWPTAAVLPHFERVLSCKQARPSSEAGLLGSSVRRAVREAPSVRAARIALEALTANAKARGRLLAPDWPDVLVQLEPFYALPPQRRHVIRDLDAAAEVLGLRLNSAVERHGPFADAHAATAFVTQTLARTRRRLRLSAAGLPAGPAQYALRVALSGIGAQPF